MLGVPDDNVHIPFPSANSILSALLLEDQRWVAGLLRWIRLKLLNIFLQICNLLKNTRQAKCLLQLSCILIARLWTCMQFLILLLLFHAGSDWTGWQRIIILNIYFNTYYWFSAGFISVLNPFFTKPIVTIANFSQVLVYKIFRQNLSAVTDWHQAVNSRCNYMKLMPKWPGTIECKLW